MTTTGNRRGLSARRKSRRAVVLIMAGVLMPALLSFVGFAVDLGYIVLIQAQLQNAADSAALAGAKELVDHRVEFATINQAFMSGPMDAPVYDQGVWPGATVFFRSTRDTTVAYAGLNNAGGASSLDLARNDDNSSSGDLIIGRFVGDGQPLDTSSDFQNQIRWNSVRVRVRRDNTLNSPVDLFFAKLSGIDTIELTATAQATFNDAPTSFGTPPTGEKSSIAPFALSLTAWNKLLAYWDDPTHVDFRSVDANGAVQNIPDGIPEINIFASSGGAIDDGFLDLGGPGQNQITPGNFGTMNVGVSANSASILRQQIRNGPTAAQMAAEDGNGLELNENITGDPGISGTIESALSAINGQTRTVMVFDTSTGTGNGSEFHVVGFVGIRFLETVLTGDNKRVIVQPAPLDGTGAKGAGPFPAFGDADVGLTL